MNGLVDWRTPMIRGSYQDELLDLRHDIGYGMAVHYSHSGEIATCGAWLTCSGLNALKQRKDAVDFFKWARGKNPLEVLEAADAAQYEIEGYTYVKHARLLRESGRFDEAKQLLLAV